MKNWKNRLTKREQSVCELVVQDLTNKEIGDRLGIQERTVERHRANIYIKLRIPSQKESLKAIYS